jgi:hypothetical protein
MNTKINVARLADWVQDLINLAKEDESFSISWFKDTEDSPIAIVGGWLSGYDSTDSDLFCMSKSNPGYAMNIKIAVNNGPYAYVDYEMINMPVEPNESVDDTQLTLEWNDNPEAIASFFVQEYDRIYNNYEMGLYTDI